MYLCPNCFKDYAIPYGGSIRHCTECDWKGEARELLRLDDPPARSSIDDYVESTEAALDSRDRALAAAAKRIEEQRAEIESIRAAVGRCMEARQDILKSGDRLEKLTNVLFANALDDLKQTASGKEKE